MTQTWFDKTCDARSELQDVAGELYSLANHCREIGLGMADRLLAMGHKVDDVENDLRIAIGQSVNQRFKDSQQSAKNMVAAALVGAEGISVETLEKIVGAKGEQE